MPLIGANIAEKIKTRRQQSICESMRMYEGYEKQTHHFFQQQCATVEQRSELNYHGILKSQ